MKTRRKVHRPELTLIRGGAVRSARSATRAQGVHPGAEDEVNAIDTFYAQTDIPAWGISAGDAVTVDREHDDVVAVHRRSLMGFDEVKALCYDGRLGRYVAPAERPSDSPNYEWRPYLALMTDREGPKRRNHCPSPSKATVGRPGSHEAAAGSDAWDNPMYRAGERAAQERIEREFGSESSTHRRAKKR